MWTARCTLALPSRHTRAGFTAGRSFSKARGKGALAVPPQAPEQFHHRVVLVSPAFTPHRRLRPHWRLQSQHLHRPAASSQLQALLRPHIIMSVVGFDVGNDASCVAIARKVRRQKGLDGVCCPPQQPAQGSSQQRPAAAACCFDHILQLESRPDRLAGALQQRYTIQQLRMYCCLRNLPPSTLPCCCAVCHGCLICTCLSELLLLLQRGIDVLMNKESKRETPAVVSFGDKMRFIGTDGAGKISMNPKNTPHQLKRLLGKQFKDPAVQVG